MFLSAGGTEANSTGDFKKAGGKGGDGFTGYCDDSRWWGCNGYSNYYAGGGGGAGGRNGKGNSGNAQNAGTGNGTYSGSGVDGKAKSDFSVTNTGGIWGESPTSGFGGGGSGAVSGNRFNTEYSGGSGRAGGACVSYIGGTVTANSIKCHGAATGKLTITITQYGSNTDTYSYTWTRTESQNNTSQSGSFTGTSKELTNLIAGLYLVVITRENDGLTYTITREVRISEPETPFEITSVSTQAVSCHPNNLIPSGTNYHNNGTATITVNGGTGKLTCMLGNLIIEDNNTTHVGQYTFEGLESTVEVGSPYTITVTDANQCSVTVDTVKVLAPPELTISTAPHSLDCSTDGWIDVTFGGGTNTTGDTVRWDAHGGQGSGFTPGINPGSIQSYTYRISNLTIPQSYDVTVIDNHQCSATKQDVVILNRKSPWPENWPLATQPQYTQTVCNKTPFTINAQDMGLEGVNNLHFTWTVTYPTDVTGWGADQFKTALTDSLVNNTEEQQSVTYHVQALSGQYCYSEWFDVTVNVRPGSGAEVSFQLADLENVYPGSPITLKTTLSGVTEGMTAKWVFNGVPTDPVAITNDVISNSSFTAPSECATTSYPYQLVVSNAYCSTNSEAFVKVNAGGLTIDPTKYKTKEISCYSEVEAPSESILNENSFTLKCGSYESEPATIVGNPIISRRTYNNCKDTITYTYTYKACNDSTAIWKYVYYLDTKKNIALADGYNDVVEISSQNCVFSYPDVTDKSRYQGFLSDQNGCTDFDDLIITQTPAAGTALEQFETPKTYQITLHVTDNCGNTADFENAVSFTVPAILTVKIVDTNVTHVTCNGLDNGRAVVTVDGGTRDYIYKWDGVVSQDDTLRNAEAGLHTVEVTDNNGCSASTYAVITEPSAIRATITPAQYALCDGDSVTLYANVNGGNAANYDYAWKKDGVAFGTNSANAVVKAAGTYSISVTEKTGNHCSNSNTDNTATITVNALPSVSISPKKDTICEGQTSTLEAETDAGNTLIWGGGSSEATFQTSTAGIYTLTVIDNNNCANSTTAQVWVNTPPAAVVLNCPGTMQYNTDGVISVRPLIENEETVTWTITSTTNSVTSTNTGVPRTDNTIQVHAAAVGTAIIEATITKTHNINDCKTLTESCTLNVAQNVMTIQPIEDQVYPYDGNPHGIALTDVVVKDANNETISDAEITFSVDGANFYENIPTITDAGTVQVTVKATHTQYNENTRKFSMTVTPRPITLTLNKCDAWTGSPMESELSEAEVTSGSFVQGHEIVSGTVTTSQGNGGVYHYNSISTTNTADISGLEIADAQNHIKTANYAVSIVSTQTILEANIINNNINNACPKVAGEKYSFGASLEGGVTLTDPVYTWTYQIDEEAEQTLSNSTTLNIDADGARHTYQVNLSLMEGACSSNTASVTLYAIDNTDPVIQSCPASVDATPNTTEENCSYLYPDVRGLVLAQDNCTATDELQITQQPTPNSLVDTETPEITVTVKDKSGNFISRVVMVKIPSKPMLSTYVSTKVTCYDGDNGRITIAEATKGTPPYSYNIYHNNDFEQSLGTANNLVFENLRADTYQVVATDANGCTSLPLEIQVNNIDSIKLTVKDETICYGGNINIGVTATGGSGYYQYSWSDNAGNQAVVNVAPVETKEYTVTVSDFYDANCTKTATCTVTVRPQFNPGSISYRNDTICKGGNVESLIGGQATGGDGNYVYEWYHNGEAIPGTNSANFRATAYTQTVGTHIFTRSVKNTACMSDFVASDGIYTLTVQSPVSIVFVNDADAARTLCEGADMEAVAIDHGHASLKMEWTDEEIYGIYLVGDQIMGKAQVESLTAEQVYPYYVVAISDEDNPKCPTDTIFGTVSVRPLPKVNLVSGTLNPTVCSGETIDNMVFEAVNAELSIEWTGNHDGVSSENFSSEKTISGTPVLMTETAPTQYAYTVTATSEFTDPSCGTTPLNGVITVNPLSNLTVGENRKQSICFEQPIEDIEVLHDANSTVRVTGLPNGVTYKEAEHKISGTPYSEGQYVYTVMATSNFTVIVSVSISVSHAWAKLLVAMTV